MKKILTVFILMIAALSLVACNSSNAPSWIMDPSGDHTAMRARFEREGWRLHPFYDRVNIRATNEPSPHKTSPGQIINLYTAYVSFFSTIEEANDFIEERVARIIESISDWEEDAFSVRFQYRRNGTIASVWIHYRGRW
ncbi:MAG: hypothetical protein FWE36_00315 [Erysipelotrichales bacterium]|nr:hypothetical protein [Erysipelotrichales bacterium]